MALPMSGGGMGLAAATPSSGGGMPAGMAGPANQQQQADPATMARMLGLPDPSASRDEQRPQKVENIAGERTDPALSQHVRAAWERNKQARMKIDRRLLACLRARRGVYSNEEIAQKQAAGGVNIAWHDLTETKCRGGSAWIRDILAPTSGERPWSCSPTTLPDLPMALKKSIVAKSLEKAQQVLVQSGANGGGTMPNEEFRDTVREIGDKLRREAEQRYKELAELRANRMADQIADRLDHGGWATAIDAFVEEFVTYPAAIIKGPVYQRHRRLEWGQGWTPKVSSAAEQHFESVPAFDCYPAPGAGTPQDGDFCERMRFWRRELFDLKGLPGYRDAEIDAALRDYSSGYLEGWLWTEAERQRLQGDTLFQWLTPPGQIDAINFYGSVPGWMLQSWGVESGETLEATREYEVNVVLVGRYLIFAALNPHPLGMRPYRRACYDEIPGSFWGRAVPELAKTSQDFANLAASYMADNLGFASGPQAWVHVDRLADGEQSLEIVPFKVWQLKDAGMGNGTNPGIGFFQAEDRTATYMRTLDFWENKADDATGIPRYTYGGDQTGGAAGTATGLSMLLNSAAKGLRRAIGNVDLCVIAPCIYDVFVNEMLFNPDESIKGDAVIVPRGAAAILIKDMAQQRRMQFLSLTGNPIDMAIIGNKGRAHLLREVAESMELDADEIVPDGEAIDQQAAAAAQAQQEQQQQAMQAAMQAETAKAQLEQQTDAAKIGAQSQAKQREQFTSVLGDALRQRINPPALPAANDARGLGLAVTQNAA